MEVLFSNHCTFDEITYGEVYALYANRRWTFLLGFLAGAYGIFMILRFYKIWYLALIGCLLVLEVLLLMFFSSKYRGKAAFRRACQLNHTDCIEIETLFMKDRFEAINPAAGGRLQMEYSQIKACKEFQDKFVIILRSRQFLCLEKNNFILGTCGEFQQFLMEQCPKAKFKLKRKKSE